MSGGPQARARPSLFCLTACLFATSGPAESGRHLIALPVSAEGSLRSDHQHITSSKPLECSSPSRFAVPATAGHEPLGGRTSHTCHMAQKGLGSKPRHHYDGETVSKSGRGLILPHRQGVIVGTCAPQHLFQSRRPFNMEADSPLFQVTSLYKWASFRTFWEANVPSPVVFHWINKAVISSQ